MTAFHQVFGQQLSLSDEMGPDDVEGWDSLMHVVLITATEKLFSVKFTGTDMANAVSVGELVSIIEAKQKSIS